VRATPERWRQAEIIEMFGYYGSKQKLASLYRPPRHDLVIEAFAGSASYALHGENWRRDVILMERHGPLATLWHWLINEATPATIMALPDVQPGQRLSGLPAMMRAVLCHLDTVGDQATGPTVTSWEKSRATMASNVWKVKHWQVRCADYFEAPDAEATWFVDPPYQGSVGEGYAHGSSSIDFARLTEWIRSRPGQVIACESGCAAYLPFIPLRPDVDRFGDRHAEFVWYKDPASAESPAPA
jgi:hypothetical protein